MARKQGALTSDTTLCQVMLLKHQAVNLASNQTSSKLLAKRAPIPHVIGPSKTLYIPRNNPHEEGERRDAALAAMRAIFEAGLEGE